MKIWEEMAQAEGGDVPPRPFDAALDALGASSASYPAALEAASFFAVVRKDWLDAYDKIVRLVEIFEDIVGVDHPDVATSRSWLELFAYHAGRTEEAELFYRQALTIREDKPGIDHPDVAATLQKLIVFAYRAGRMEEAEVLYRRALTIREEKLVVDHLDVASTLHDLGLCAYRLGRVEKAEELYRRALTIREVKLGVDHPFVANTPAELAVCASLSVLLFWAVPVLVACVVLISLAAFE